MVSLGGESRQSSVGEAPDFNAAVKAFGKNTEPDQRQFGFSGCRQVRVKTGGGFIGDEAGSMAAAGDRLLNLCQCSGNLLRGIRPDN